MAEYIDREALLKRLCDGDPSKMEDYYRGIHEYFEGVIEDEKSLERYGLSYANDYDESPEPLWCEDCQHFKNYPYAMSGEGYCDIDHHETWYGCPICEKYEKKGVKQDDR